MYCDFISLKDAPLSVQEAAENIHMTINGEWYYDDRVEKEQVIASFKDTKKLLADVMTMKYKDEEMLLLFKMTIYRFCKIHIPNMLKNLKKDDFDGFLLTFYREKDDNEKLNDWEKEFWRGGSDFRRKSTIMMFSHDSLSYFRNRLRVAKPISESNNEYYNVKNVMDSAFKDMDTLTKVKALQQEYGGIANNTEKINDIWGKHFAGNREELLLVVQNIKKIADILERSIQGTLTAGDVMELKENSGEWSNGMNVLKDLFIGVE